MLKILNRFAWFLSLAIGISLVSLFTRRLNDESFFIIIIVILIIKGLFLSKNFIQKNLKSSLGIKEEMKEEEEYEKEKNEESVKSNAIPFTPEDFEAIKENEKQIAMQQESIRGEKKQERLEEKKEKGPNIFVQFFSENLLAKIGGILVFLGVIFLLGLVYTKLGPVGRIIIGFIIGFGSYIAGVIIEKKGFDGESKVLMGVGILINYAVILSGRYLLGDENGMILSITMTFVFLILNTLFSVTTALVYNSNLFLIFSFIFAFLNPLLIGGSADNPYTLIGYALIVALGGLFLSLSNRVDNKRLLIYTAFIGGNILILGAPFSGEIDWISKLIAFSFLSIISIYFAYKQGFSKEIHIFFIISYVFLFGLFSYGTIGINGLFEHSAVFVSYMISLLILFGFAIFFFMISSVEIILSTLIAPLFFVLLGVFFAPSAFFAFTIMGTLFAYLFAFFLLFSSLSTMLFYTLFSFLTFFLAIINFVINMKFGNVFTSLNFSPLDFFIMSFCSLVFLGFSYIFSQRKGYESLYGFGTIGVILSLIPLVSVQNSFCAPTEICADKKGILIISVITLSIFSLANWLLPFFNKLLTEKKENFKYTITGLIAGAIFISYEVFQYGKVYFDGISLGFAFVALAIIYFFLAYIMIQKLGVYLSEEAKGKDEIVSKNLVYSYIGSSISLFSLAMVYIFSGHNEIISSIWIFEAATLFYFFKKTKDKKVFAGASLVYLIGIGKLFFLISQVRSLEYLFFATFFIILLFVAFILKFVDDVKEEKIRSVHDIIHILAIVVLPLFIGKIIISHNWLMFGYGLFIGFLAFIYTQSSSLLLKGFFVFLLALFAFSHTGEVPSILRTLEKQDKSFLQIIQYITTGVVGVSAFYFNKFSPKKAFKIALFFINVAYLIVITTQYIYYLFDKNTFSITIYWGLLAFGLINRGITNNIPRKRSIGLYILFLTLGKILLYDVWMGLDNSIVRVIALILIGILMLILSSMYTKQYNGNLKQDLNLLGMLRKKIAADTPEDDDKENKEKNEVPEKEETKKEESSYQKEKNDLINKKIENIDIKKFVGVKFYINNGEIIGIKAKNLIKVVLLVTEKMKKTSFEKNELKEAYDFIIKNYKTELPATQFKRITDILEKFVVEGGKIEFIEEK